MPIEHALHIYDIASLKQMPSPKPDRVYWGVEFCQKLIPSIEHTKKIFSWARRAKCAFTLITPFVTEEGLKALNALFSYLATQETRCEIIINDWGVLNTLNASHRDRFDLGLGRILAHQYRVPFETGRARKPAGKGMLNIEERLPPAVFIKGIRNNWTDAAEAQTFLKRHLIKRVECNHVVQGMGGKKGGLNRSLYTPFVNVSTTRFCPLRTDEQKRTRLGPCLKECRSFFDAISVTNESTVLYQRGNTLFYHHPLTNERKAAAAGYDRIVHQPDLPR